VWTDPDDEEDVEHDLKEEHTTFLNPGHEAGVKYLRQQRRLETGSSVKYLPVPFTKLANVKWSLTTGDRAHIPSFEYVEGPYTLIYLLIKIDVKALRPGEPAIRSLFLWGETHAYDLPVPANELEAFNSHPMIDWLHAVIKTNMGVYWDLFLEAGIDEHPDETKERRQLQNPDRAQQSTITKINDEFQACFVMDKSECPHNDTIRFHAGDMRERMLGDGGIRKVADSSWSDTLETVKESRLIDEDMPSDEDQLSSEGLAKKAEQVLLRRAQKRFASEKFVDAIIANSAGVSVARFKERYPEYTRMLLERTKSIILDPFIVFKDHQKLSKTRRFQKQDIHPLMQDELDKWVVRVFRSKQKEYRSTMSSLKRSWDHYQQEGKSDKYIWVLLLNVIIEMIGFIVLDGSGIAIDEFIPRRMFRRFHLPETERNKPWLQYCSNLIYYSGAAHSGELLDFLKHNSLVTILDQKIMGRTVYSRSQSLEDLDERMAARHNQDGMAQSVSARENRVHLTWFPREVQVVSYQGNGHELKVPDIQLELTFSPVDWWSGITLTDCVGLSVFRMNHTLVYLWLMHQPEMVASPKLSSSHLGISTARFLSDKRWHHTRAHLIQYRSGPTREQALAQLEMGQNVFTSQTDLLYPSEKRQRLKRRRETNTAETKQDSTDEITSLISHDHGPQSYHLLLDTPLALLVWRKALESDPSRMRMLRVLPLTKDHRWSVPHYFDSTDPLSPLFFSFPSPDFTMPFLNV